MSNISVSYLSINKLYQIKKKLFLFQLLSIKYDTIHCKAKNYIAIILIFISHKQYLFLFLINIFFCFSWIIIYHSNF